MMVIAKLLSSILEQAPAIAAAITKVDYHDSRTKIAKGSGKNTEKSTTTTKQSYSLRQATTEKKPDISDSNQLVAKR